MTTIMIYKLDALKLKIKSIQLVDWHYYHKKTKTIQCILIVKVPLLSLDIIIHVGVVSVAWCRGMCAAKFEGFE